MTASGDGLSFDFLDAADLPAKHLESSAPSPLGIPATEKPAQKVSSECLGAEAQDAVEEGIAASIFDDDPEPGAESLHELPDAIPNISDEGTEILVRGRTEILDFAEVFGSPLTPANTASDVDSCSAKPSLLDAITQQSDPASASADEIQNPLGGMFLDEIDESNAASHVEPFADTVIAESPFRGMALPELGHAPAIELADVAPDNSDSHTTAEAPAISLDGLSDSGLSLSSLDVSTTVSGIERVAPLVAVAPSGNRLILIAVGGYALVVTALCVMLLSLLAKAKNAGQLESLPDLKPIPPNSISPIRVDAELPAGHTLTLGQSQRFGHLRVEPVKVTRSPIQFQHFSRDPENKGFASEPVLKLWVKLTNESPEQAFVPLDGDLMFRRHFDSAGDTDRANTFLVQRKDKPRSSPLVYVYDHPYASSNWDLAGQHLGRQLQPGESLETYIPTTEEGIDRLRGDLLWRIQVRKGHSPAGYGVTTLIEVAFTADQIQSEGT